MKSSSAAKTILRLLKLGQRRSNVMEYEAMDALEALQLTPGQRSDVEFAIRSASRVEVAQGSKWGTSDYPKILRLFQKKGLVESVEREGTLQYEVVCRMLLERFGEPLGDNQGVPSSAEKKDMGNRGFGSRLEGCDELDEDELSQKAPPGGEKVVKALKKDKKIKNPFAVAWAMKNRGEI